MTLGELLFFTWSIAPVAFGAWASTPYARVVMPGVLTWFYRYLIGHFVLLLMIAQSLSVPHSLTFYLLASFCVWFLLYDYFNANKPDHLPLGIKLVALISVAKDGAATHSWPPKPSFGTTSAAVDGGQSSALQRAQPTEAARSRGIGLGLLGTHHFSADERGRLWAYERLFKARTKTLAANTEVNEATIAALRSDEQLHEAFERTIHLQDNPDEIRARVREEFQAEDDERAIRRAERQRRRAEHERGATEAAGKQEATTAQIEFDRRRREARLAGEVPPSLTAEDRFRQRAEQIAKYGSTGRFMPIAEEMRATLIAQRGGEEHLTDEDLDRIELIFAEARRQEESRS